jgi:Pentapeptide repeats (8 copies)
MLAVVSLLASSAAAAQSPSARSGNSLERTLRELEAQKLQLELDDLRAEPTTLEEVARYSAIFTVVVAIIGLGAGGVRYLIDQRRNRQRQLEQAVEAEFTAAVSLLAQFEPGARAAGVATLKPFLNDHRAAHHPRAYELLRLLIKLDNDDPMSALIADLFTAFLRLGLGSLSNGDQDLVVGTFRPTLEINDARLPNVDLSRLDLTGIHCRGTDMPGANLGACRLDALHGESANLENAGLQRANVSEATLKRARLVGAKFREARLSRCSLIEAEAGGADFRGARLISVSYTRTELAGALFAGATFNDPTLASLHEATSFDPASLDPAARVRFDQLKP